MEIIRTLGIDTAPYDKFLSHEETIARTIMLDRQLKGIIEADPNAVIVNLGAGFDNRFSRVDNGSILWFDLDLPDVIAARKKVFPAQDRVTMIEGSVLENDWCETVRRAAGDRSVKPVFVAEGMFMYFTLDQIRNILTILRDNFPDGGGLLSRSRIAN